MRFAQVVAVFPPRLGGMGRVCFEEARELVRNGHEVTVCTLAFETNDAKEDSAYPFKVVRLSAWPLFGDAGFVPQLFFQLKKYDIVHLHFPFYGGAEWVWLAHWWYGVPYVATYHMDSAPRGLIKRMIQKVYDAVFAKMILRGAEKVLAVTKEHLVHSRFGKNLLPSHWQELPIGVDIDFFKPQVISWNQLGFPALEGKKVLLFVGNLIPFKRLDLLLKALKEIVVDHKDAYVVVVGGGYAEKEYHALSKELGLGDRVFFLGSCYDQRRLVEYYAAAWGVVLPSTAAESFSLVVSEALATGCPVVVSDIPGLKERVVEGKEGFVFSANEALPALIRALRALLNLSAPERAQMSLSARARAEKESSWQEHAHTLEKIYDQILTQKTK